MEEEITTLHKNTIQYLHDISEKLPSSLNVLKSYWASKYRISELQTKISVEKSKNKLEARCFRCCLKLNETSPSHVVRPARKKSKFAEKVLKKVHVNRSLTRYQEKYLKKNKLKTGQKTQLVVTCSFCKKESVFSCIKPVKVRVANKATIVEKKKKKKKDKFCGLQKHAVVSAQKKVKKVVRRGIVDLTTPVQKNPRKHDKKSKEKIVDITSATPTVQQLPILSQQKKKKKKKQNRQEVIDLTTVTPRVIHTEIFKKRQKQKELKKREKLFKLLNQKSSQPKNNLGLFLQSVS